MAYLFKEIKLNGKQEEYSKKLYNRNKKIKQNMEQSDMADKLVRKMLHKKGVLGEVTLERRVKELEEETARLNQIIKEVTEYMETLK